MNAMATQNTSSDERKVRLEKNSKQPTTQVDGRGAAHRQAF
jgi:hypothetical protein